MTDNNHPEVGLTEAPPPCRRPYSTALLLRSGGSTALNVSLRGQVPSLVWNQMVYPGGWAYAVADMTATNIFIDKGIKVTLCPQSLIDTFHRFDSNNVPNFLKIIGLRDLDSEPLVGYKRAEGREAKIDGVNEYKWEHRLEIVGGEGTDEALFRNFRSPKPLAAVGFLHFSTPASCSRGIITPPYGGPYHGVLVLGVHYDPNDIGSSYYEIKNSCGPRFGEGGFAKFALGSFDSVLFSHQPCSTSR